MEKREVGLNPVRSQEGNKPKVICRALRVDFAASFGKKSGPGNRKTIGFDPEGLQQGDIFFEVRITVWARALFLRESVPDAFATAIFSEGTFDLKGGSRRAPNKIFRECHAVIVPLIADFAKGKDRS